MGKSKISRFLTVIDIPEVKTFDATFKYNFFVSDEKGNESGIYVDPYDLEVKNVPDGNQVTIINNRDELRRVVPRWVEFSFKPVAINSTAGVDNEFVLNISRPTNVNRHLHTAIMKNDGVQREIEVATRGYSTLTLQDDKIGIKSSQLMQRHAQGFRPHFLELDAELESQSSTEVAEILTAVTSNFITSNQIDQLLGSLNNNLYFRYNPRTGERISYTEKWEKDIMNVIHYSQFNNRFYSSIIRQAIMNTMGPFSGELSYPHIKGKAVKAQSAARANTTANVISSLEYCTNLKPIGDPVPIDVSSSTFRNNVEVIGYIIDKKRIYKNGKVETYPPIILSSRDFGTAMENNVAYGAVYSYSIRTVALVQLQASDAGQMYMVSGLVSSRNSHSVQVLCREFNPPPPPGDMDFIWDYKHKKMSMMWSFPVVRTRDIKRFQVFRRSSLYEPFQLLAEFDFDDSEIRDPRTETPRSDRVFKMDHPSTIYTDEEFTKSSKYIYALCSMDAHDFSSNYSQQFVVSFDENENRIVKKLISPSGAPKSYPNFYLIADSDTGTNNIEITSDSIKDSGHTKGTIFFDPEYLSIRDKDGGDLGLLSVTDNSKQAEGRYKLQIINVDRQKSKVINIDLKDLRGSK